MKRRIVAVGLVVLGLWPLVQYGLTQRYGVDPWKLFGFAMYSVPGPMKTVRLVQIDSDGSYRMLDYRRYPAGLGPAVDAFRERRRALGALAGSEALAESVLEAFPKWEGAVVVVLSLELDRNTALMQPRITHEQTHWRDGRDQPFVFPEPLLGDAAAPSA